MKKNRFCYLLLLALSLAILSSCSRELEVTIIHMNDSHSHVEEVPFSAVIEGEKKKMFAGGFARISSKIQSIRQEKENVLFLHAGDAVQGTLYFTKYHGEPEFEWLNWMKCDAMVTGNHEFDKGSALLARFLHRANFPILAGNVDASADPILKSKLASHTIIERKGQQIAIIGVVSPDTSETSNPDETIIFKKVTETVSSIIEKLKEENINKIIVVSHIGYERDIELASSVNDIDIIVGGHTHSFLGGARAFIHVVDGMYPTTINNPADKPVYIVQAGAHALGIGMLDVVFDGNGQVLSCNGSTSILLNDKFLQKNPEGEYAVVSVEENKKILDIINSSSMVEIVPEDPSVISKLLGYRSGIEELKSQVIGHIDHSIPHVRVPGYRHPGTGEEMPEGSELAPVVADAMVWKADQIGLNPDLAIQNAGGVRMDLQSGDVTVGDIYELMPFENTLFILELRGDIIKTCLESLLERILIPDNDGSYPYTSRLRFDIDWKMPTGERMKQIEIQNDEGLWSELQDDKTYRIATSHYLAAGRDGYKLLNSTDGYRYDTGFLDAELFIEYLQAGNIK